VRAVGSSSRFAARGGRFTRWVGAVLTVVLATAFLVGLTSTAAQAAVRTCTSPAATDVGAAPGADKTLAYPIGAAIKCINGNEIPSRGSVMGCWFAAQISVIPKSACMGKKVQAEMIAQTRFIQRLGGANLLAVPAGVQ